MKPAPPVTRMPFCMRKVSLASGRFPAAALLQGKQLIVINEWLELPRPAQIIYQY